MRSSTSLLTILFLSSLSTFADERPEVERIWTGKNKVTFRGTYVDTIENGAKVRFLTSAGKLIEVTFGNISEADQKLIKSFEEKAVEAPKSEDDLSNKKLKDLPLADRNLMPKRKPKDFGGDAEDSMVDSIWISMLWWNMFEVLPIPKSGDFDKQATWLHKELTREIAKGGRSATTAEEAKEGILDYFEKNLKDVAGCKIKTLSELQNEKAFKGFNPAGLSELVRDNHVVILKLDMIYDDRKEYSESVSLEQMDADGNFTIHSKGERLTGKVKTVPHPNRNEEKKGKKVQEFVISNRDQLCEHHQKNKAKFYADVSSWNDLLVIEPFVYDSPKEK